MTFSISKVQFCFRFLSFFPLEELILLVLSHNSARPVGVVRTEYLLATLKLVGSNLFSHFFRKIFSEELGMGRVEVVLTRPHDHIAAAQGAKPLAFSLHLDQAAATEDVVTVQPDRPVRNGEAYRAEIVVELRDDGDDFGGHLSTQVFGHAPRKESVRVDGDRERLGNSEGRSLVELWQPVSGWMVLESPSRGEY